MIRLPSATYDQAVSTMLRLIGAEPGGTGAGGGTGVHSVRVARAGYRVFAVNISQTMLQETRERIGAAGLASAVEFRQEHLTRLTFPDALCRYVFSWGVVIQKWTSRQPNCFKNIDRTPITNWLHQR